MKSFMETDGVVSLLPRLTLESLAILPPQECPLARVLACVWPSHFSNRYCVTQSYVGLALQHAVIPALRRLRQREMHHLAAEQPDTKRSAAPIIESRTGVLMLVFILVGPPARMFVLVRS